MKARHLISTLVILGSPFAAAQNVTGEPAQDPVLDALQEFKRHDQDTAEVLTAAAVPLTPPPTVEAAAPASPEPVPAVDEKPASNEPEALEEDPASLAETTSKEPADGLTVRVEKLNAGNRSVDPSKVKLLAPYPAKPLSQAPAGWQLDASNDAPSFTREVELSPGSKITLTIRPHVLIPEADGASVFNISEPGFDPARGHRQTATVGSILSNSVRQLDEDARQLSSAIDNLQQLLVSLPNPQPAPPPESAKPVINRKK